GAARGDPGRGGGAEGGDIHRQGRERVWDPEGGTRRPPPRPAEPIRPGTPPTHLLRTGDRQPAASGGHGRRDRRKRSPRRHVSGERRRRPAREQDRFRRPPDPPPDGDRRQRPKRALSVVEQADGDEDPALATR